MQKPRELHVFQKTEIEHPVKNQGLDDLLARQIVSKKEVKEVKIEELKANTLSITVAEFREKYKELTTDDERVGFLASLYLQAEQLIRYFAHITDKTERRRYLEKLFRQSFNLVAQSSGLSSLVQNFQRIGFMAVSETLGFGIKDEDKNKQ